MIGVVEKFAEGLFNWRVHPGGRKDELGRLGKDLNRMAQAIGEKVDQLSKNLAETEALLAGMEEGVLILELNGRIKKINEAMGAILPQAYPSDVGKHYLEVFRDPELNDLIQETLAAKQGQRRTLSPLSQPGRSFHVQSSLIQDTKNGVGGVIVVFHDVTDLKRLERIRQDFVANVSHELRTPLTAIRGYVEALLEEDRGSVSQAEKFLRVIERHTQRMEKIVSDLLLLSEMESPDRLLNRTPLHFQALISVGRGNTPSSGRIKTTDLRNRAIYPTPAHLRRQPEDPSGARESSQQRHFLHSRRRARLRSKRTR